MGLAKVSAPKRGQFFNYDVWTPLTVRSDTGADYLSTYNAVATTLLLRRQEVMGTAVPLAPNAYNHWPGPVDPTWV